MWPAERPTGASTDERASDPGGRAIWKEALELAVVQEKETVDVLTEGGRVQLNTLLRKVVLGLET